MTSLPADPRNLWYGAPTGDDSQRSSDEVRIINEMTSQEVETFLAANAVDMGAANQLRREPTHIALAVIERGPLRSCRDPSGVIVARIRDAKKGTLGPARTGPSAKPAAPLPPAQAIDPNASQIDQFLAMNRIDTAGVIAMKNESPDVQMAVMGKGPLSNSTNPSASLVARIRLIKEPGQAGLAPGQPPPPAGTPALMAPLPGPPMGAPPLALQDNGSGGDMNMEAMKAIQKMGQVGGQFVQSQPGAVPPPPMMPPPANGNMQPQSGNINNVQDKRLQDEALMAIQGLNYADL